MTQKELNPDQAQRLFTQVAGQYGLLSDPQLQSIQSTVMARAAQGGATDQYVRSQLMGRLIAIDVHKAVQLRSYGLQPEEKAVVMRAAETSLQTGGSNQKAFGAAELAIMDVMKKSKIAKAEEGSVSGEAQAQKLSEIAYNAYKYGQTMHGTYDQKESRNFQVIATLRDSQLHALGFRNTDKAVMPATGMTASQLVPADGGFLRSNIKMFNGLVAPLVLEGAAKGEVKISEEERKALVNAATSDESKWGYHQIDSFLSPKAADYLQAMYKKNIEKKDEG